MHGGGRDPSVLGKMKQLQVEASALELRRSRHRRGELKGPTWMTSRLWDVGGENGVREGIIGRQKPRVGNLGGLWDWS